MIAQAKRGRRGSNQPAPYRDFLSGVGSITAGDLSNIASGRRPPAGSIPKNVKANRAARLTAPKPAGPCQTGKRSIAFETRPPDSGCNIKNARIHKRTQRRERSPALARAGHLAMSACRNVTPEWPVRELWNRPALGQPGFSRPL
jgi:hypothetical protein